MRIPPHGGWLLAGAAASFALVLLHLGVIVTGAPAYAFFLAGDWMVDMAKEHAMTPTLVTGAIAFVFAVFGSYALAGAGLLELPATRVLNLLYRLYPDEAGQHPELEPERQVLKRFIKGSPL